MTIERKGGHMLVEMLGFGGRMGRLRFVLWSIGAGVGLTVLTAMLMAGASSGEGFLKQMVLVVLPLWLWSGAALTARRLRDIGWPAFRVMAGWLCFAIIDAAVAQAVPALALGETGSTLPGGLVEIALVLALLFWPGRPADDAYEGDRLDADAARRRYRDEAFRPRAAAPAPGPGGFGRRG